MPAETETRSRETNGETRSLRKGQQLWTEAAAPWRPYFMFLNKKRSQKSIPQQRRADLAEKAVDGGFTSVRVEDR